LQEQYVQTPHYVVLLYLYAKYIVKARIRDLYPAALGVLSEITRHGVHKRSHNAHFYMGLIEESNGMLEAASMHFETYLKGSSVMQVSNKLDPLRQFTKDVYIAKFQETSLDDMNHTSINARIAIESSIAKLKGKQPAA
jgi:hypothetical protein